MVKVKRQLVKERLYWSYANLAMAHTAVERKQDKYNTFNFMIRAKLYKGLMTGEMNTRTLFDDEKVKLQVGQVCSYCGAKNDLALDHIFSQKLGGKDSGDNLICACKKCNSSKGMKDLMEWMSLRGEFLPLMVIRRYLKLVICYCAEGDLMDKKIEELEGLKLPFKIEFIPESFPAPEFLKMT